MAYAGLNLRDGARFTVFSAQRLTRVLVNIRQAERRSRAQRDSSDPFPFLYSMIVHIGNLPLRALDDGRVRSVIFCQQRRRVYVAS
jgi:hypothetical protein